MDSSSFTLGAPGLGLPAMSGLISGSSVPGLPAPGTFMLPPISEAPASGLPPPAVLMLPPVAETPAPADIVFSPLASVPEIKITAGPSVPAKTLTLLPGQEDHVAKLEHALLAYSRALDVSDTGMGKTFTTCHLALKYGWKLFVVAPKTVCTMKWDTVPHEYGLEAMVYNYKKSPTGFQGLLSSTKVEKKTYFQATKELKAMFDSRTLLVFDEIHHLKNPGTIQLAACSELARVAIEQGGRIIGLSATPIEDPKHAPSLFRALGVMTREKPYVYDYSAKEFVADGIIEIQAFANRMDPEKVKQLHPASIHRTNGNKYVRDIFNQVVLPAIRSRIMPTEGEDTVKDMKNLFMPLDDVNMAKLLANIEYLNALTQQHKEAGVPGANFGQVTTMLKQIEAFKVPLFIRAIESALRKPHVKVVMGVNFLDTMDLLESHFKRNPSVYWAGDVPMYEFLTGDYTQAERESTLNDFHTDPSLRILLVSPKVGGEGIDLHATDGKTQIYEFASPSYNHTEMIQFLGRAHRKGQTSVPVIRIVYVDDQEGKIQRELSIMDSLNGKSENMAEARGMELDDCQMPGSLVAETEAEFLAI